MPSVGAGLIVEWADEDGKWCGSGEYACGIYGTKDWRKVECRNLMANQRAAYAIFYLAVRGSGCAWFDDVTLVHDEVSADKFAPADGATLADNVPFFTWRPHRGARRYTVELSRDPAFGDGAVRSYDAGGIAEFQLVEPLEPGIWYWRVLASGTGGSWRRGWRIPSHGASRRRRRLTAIACRRASSREAHACAPPTSPSPCA